MIFTCYLNSFIYRSKAVLNSILYLLNAVSMQGSCLDCWIEYIDFVSTCDRGKWQMISLLLTAKCKIYANKLSDLPFGDILFRQQLLELILQAFAVCQQGSGALTLQNKCIFQILNSKFWLIFYITLPQLSTDYWSSYDR